MNLIWVKIATLLYRMTRFGKGYKLKRLLFKEPLFLNYLYLLLTFQLTANELPKRSVGTPSLVFTIFFDKLVFIVI